MFTSDFRDRVRDRVLALAEADARVVSGAVVGSMALGPGDRWSDLDLTFSVADEAPISDVLRDWTAVLTRERGAVTLFDLPSEASIYRVFLLPGCLQVDLSFTPASAFGARGPAFRLLFGNAIERPYVPEPDPYELFGYAVHHALRARFCIERGRYWQAEYWISGVRDYGLSLACRRRDLPARNGRGYDALPLGVRDAFAGSLVRSLERDELLRALTVAVEALLGETEQMRDIAEQVEAQLRELIAQRDLE